jgi:uncharacterized delta-60 repeat protein
MKKINLTIIAFIFGLLSYGQDGTLDDTFAQGTGVNGGAIFTTVRTIVMQPDGKIIIGGDFTDYNGTFASNIARLNSDGTFDSSFNTGSGPDGDVYTTAIQPDGKIIIGGNFTDYDGSVKDFIARLNTDGQLDGSFNSNTGTGANNLIVETVIQSDGKILIGGFFTSYNGTAVNRIARLNANGSLDTAFNLGTGVDAAVYAMAMQADGKIVIGGNFTTYNSTAINRIARLNTDGTLDTTFNPGTGLGTSAGASLREIQIQPDGKILIGGIFSTYNGTTVNRIARLNTDGSLDTTFNQGTGTSGTVFSIGIQQDGKIVIGGGFSTYNDTTINRIARLNTNGSLDTTFNPGVGANNPIVVTAIQPDGKILVGGIFSTYNGTAITGIVRLKNAALATESFFKGQQVAVFPNPASNFININFQDLNNANVEVADVNGRLLFSQKLNSRTNAINIDNLASGIYLFKVSSQEGTATAKVIKN